jgi:hypothetical protein
MSASALSIIQLGEVIGRQLDPLLLDETVEWERELDWDFSRSADLVRQFTDSKALSGAAILDRGEVIGYGYAVIEGDKAVVGDVYVRPGWRTLELEVRLFSVILDALIGTPGIRRVESQLMLLPPAVGAELLRGRPLEVRERLLMTVDAAPLGPFVTDRAFRIEEWSDSHQEFAAFVISDSYEDHVDSRINEQYRSIEGARRFLTSTRDAGRSSGKGP